MSKDKLKDKDLRDIGFMTGRLIGLAIQTAKEHKDYLPKNEKITLLKSILDEPESFIEHEIWHKLAAEIILVKTEAERKEKEEAGVVFKLNDNESPIAIYGRESIDEEAIKQIKIASKLPITVATALMPDAHSGYGLPIGGVLAAENAVIPYGVGVDIGCRMCLSIFPISPDFEKRKSNIFRDLLLENTRFGAGRGFEKPIDDDIFSRSEFSEISLVKNLKDTAFRQIGSSGGGNHFVEFGISEILEENNEWNVPVGKYLALLSHSGSRGLGATIANHFTTLAKKVCKLPKEAQNLAFLMLDTQLGQEYWIAMNLAGDYASACHHQIHARMAASLHEKPLFMVENHHNFAWKEKLADGKEVIMHRKGATPAHEGVYGIIPGSMATAGYIVRGKGDANALFSASHGAGRLLSRSKAIASISNKTLQQTLEAAGVMLIGGGLDEAPQAYKNIEEVMRLQSNLVDVIGTFMPKIVRMAED